MSDFREAVMVFFIIILSARLVYLLREVVWRIMDHVESRREELAAAAEVPARVESVPRTFPPSPANDCGHRHREPVRTMAGEIVAQICLDCDEALPTEWGCLDCRWGWIGVFGQPRLRGHLIERCERHQWSA